MAGGIHASSPGSATVTHRMGHTIIPPEYTLSSQAILENGVNSNDVNNDINSNLESSTSRKRKHSADSSNLQLDSKRTCIYDQLLTDMIIEKEKFLYISLLDKYGCSDENDIFNLIDKNNFPNSFLPFPNPQHPKSIYFSSEPEYFRKLFPSDIVSKLRTIKGIKQESNEIGSISNPDSSESPIFKSSFRTSSTTSENSQHIVEKAKQEAYVLQRVAELQKNGLWTERRLPKVQEPPRIKAHWDYVLEELEWLATDFAQERKWKKAAARKRSRMVQKHFQEREALVQKAAKAAEFNKRKIASHLAKMVKAFWSNVEKFVDFKQQTILKEKRQQALDQHLSFIVDKTEQYSSLVAESMNKSSISVLTNSQTHSPTLDAEFEPSQSSTDDEETIEAEEKVHKTDSIDVNKEIEILKKESELPIEDLLSQLPADYLNNRPNELDDEYEVDNDDVSDDETTLLEEEKTQGTVDYALEIAELEADNNLSLEDLMKKYNSGVSPKGSSNAVSQSESTTDNEDEGSETCSSSNEEIDEEDKRSNKEENVGLMSLLKDSALENGDVDEDNADEKIDDVAAIAESIQPKGNTLSSTCVVTKVPFLLKHSLREYQHIGLDWLVTMYERKLNGILADEMGLGKTIQTIALLAHLACDKKNWGPHLIIVPTSVMLNWEMEFKKWCPAFKILTYYGNPKERKLKRAGWTKPNTFHVCITSYKLVLQDHHCFRRKKWKYLILDEAQNIKNFKSQRWQRLLNFDSERRLLLTGTPLQNNLMELWSLMHFLMPNLFSSHREFKEWFSNPVTGMIEGNSEYNENIIKRLHKVLRPFLLRRLKVEVEKQLPRKYEHVVMCRLSNRQRYLYDDFMSRAKTKETLSSGNLLSVINVLMQLRKVCNHPNLFESRPIISPFQMENIVYRTASLVDSILDYDPFTNVNLNSLNLRLIDLEHQLTAWSVYRLKILKLPRPLIEEISETPEPPPIAKGKLNIRLKTPNDLNTIRIDNNIKSNQKIMTFLKKASAAGASENGNGNIFRPGSTSNQVKLAPIFRTVLGQGEMNSMAVKRVRPIENIVGSRNSYTLQLKRVATINPASTSVVGIASTSSVISVSAGSLTPKLTNSISQIIQSSTGKPVILTSSNAITKCQSTSTTVKTTGGQRLILTTGNFDSRSKIDNIRLRIPNSSVQSGTILNNGANPSIPSSTIILNNSLKTSISIPKPISTVSASSASICTNLTQHSISSSTRNKTDKTKEEMILNAAEIEARRSSTRKNKLRLLADLNERKSSPYVMFGCDVRNTLKVLSLGSESPPSSVSNYWKCAGHVNCINAQYAMHVHNLCYTLTNALANSVKSIEERIQELSDTFSRYIVYVPAVNARRPTMHLSHPNPSKAWSLSYMECMLEKDLTPRSTNLHQIVSRMSTAFPDSRLIQYDCGKLQTLDALLRRLKVEQHRVLIFTQMARMLDVLEAFLTFHGHIYLRLDGSTRIDQRQVLMERFNADKRYFCFILSTRSGGIGVNLTGADTVIFYDSDWNPTMDAQAQDRCHRIGQTRDVHIYRLISEKTVEENILKKANQKKLLGDLAIEGGNFTAAYFKSTTIHDLFNVDFNEADPAKRMNDIISTDHISSQPVEKSTLNAYESALAAAEDETDVTAARTAKEEAVAELAEFDENIPLVDNECNLDSSSLPVEEVSKAEQEVNSLIQQLMPIERWALQFMETVDTEWAEEQLAAAEAEIEQQKKEWEMERLAIEQADERSKRLDEEIEDDDVPLTYAMEDAKNQTWISFDTLDQMPIWLPLPAILSVEDYETHVDRSLKFLYETTAISEHLLPPIYSRRDRDRDRKKMRTEQPSSNSPSENSSHRGRRQVLSNVTLSVASLEPPKSLFDRPSSIVVKLRQDMRLQKYRGLSRSTVANVSSLKPYFPPKVIADPDFVPEWFIHEDYALLQAIQHVQELPLNLSVMYPGHLPNWDLVSELVNQVSRIYRSPQQCKNRYESAILPREEGKLTSDLLAKKHKKIKGMSIMSHTKYTRNYKTAQLYLQDSNSTFTQMMNTRFDAIRGVSNRRAPTIRRLPITASTNNPRQARLLAECEIDYDRPLTPVEIATKRAQRLAKEKQTQLASNDPLLLRHAGVAQPAPTTKSQPVQTTQLPSPQLQQQLQSPIAPKTIPVTNANVVPQPTAVVVNVSQTSAITTASPVITRALVSQPLTVQEMIVTSKFSPSQQSATIVSNNSATQSPQKFRTIAQIATTNTVTVPKCVADGKLLTPAQLQLLRQQNVQSRQSSPQFTIFHSRNKTPVMVPTSVVVTSPPQSQQRQIKSASGTVTSSPLRSVTEAEMTTLLKKQQQQPQLQQQQQQAKVNAAVVTNASAVQTQFITSPTTVAQAKTAVGIQLPTIKTTTINASNIKASGTTQQFRHIAIPQQFPRSKFTTQKVTPIGQVMVNVTQSGQVISQVLTKSSQGNVAAAQLMNARVIPFISSPSGGKQTIQVVSASLRAANTSNVSVDTSGARHIQPTLPSNAIKISGSTSTVAVTTLNSQQHLLNQVSAALQNNPSLRPGSVRIQSAGIASSTVSSAAGNVVSASNQIITLPTTQSHSTPSEKKTQ